MVSECMASSMFANILHVMRSEASSAYKYKCHKLPTTAATPGD